MLWDRTTPNPSGGAGVNFRRAAVSLDDQAFRRLFLNQSQVTQMPAEAVENQLRPPHEVETRKLDLTTLHQGIDIALSRGLLKAVLRDYLRHEIVVAL
jgi:hypothetical protein